MTNQARKISINPEAVLRTEDEGAFLFDPNTGRICYLNDMGATIWKLCESPVTSEEIVGRISSEYTDVPRGQISEDCSRFFEDLERLGFLK